MFSITPESLTADRRRHVAVQPPRIPLEERGVSTSSIPTGTTDRDPSFPRPPPWRGNALNADGERFMSRYAPKAMSWRPATGGRRADLPGDVRDGRSWARAKDYVHLDAVIWAVRLSRGSCRTSPVRPSTSAWSKPVPVVPTAHYAMGGIPTDLRTRVVRDEANTVVEGLFAAGGRRLVFRPRQRTASARTRSWTCSPRATSWPRDGRLVWAPVGAAVRRFRTSRGLSVRSSRRSGRIRRARARAAPRRSSPRS